MPRISLAFHIITIPEYLLLELEGNKENRAGSVLSLFMRNVGIQAGENLYDHVISSYKQIFPAYNKQIWLMGVMFVVNGIFGNIFTILNDTIIIATDMFV